MGGDKVTPFTGGSITVDMFPPGGGTGRSLAAQTSRRMLKAASFKKTNSREGLHRRFLSIRVVLILVTILTVLAMGIGMIVISTDTQHEIVNDLSAKIQDNVAIIIEKEMDDVFDYASDNMYNARLLFKNPDNYSDTPFHDNPFFIYPEIGDYFWSIIRMRPTGIDIEFDYPDGRAFGFQAYDGQAQVFWVDVDPEVNTTLVEYDWTIELNQTVASVNFSINNTADMQFWEDSVIYDPVMEWYSCDDPIIWWNITLFIQSGVQKYYIYTLGPICNEFDEYVGDMAMSVTIESILEALTTITTTIASGKIFIMDSDHRLVATSTNTNLYTKEYNAEYGYSWQQATIFNTSEVWVMDVMKAMDGFYGVQQRTVSINGTKYYLDVRSYDKLTDIEWFIVTLFDEKQFLGNTAAYFLKSVLTAVAVTVAALVVVILVTWGTTNPLFVLAADLQKMSQLDMNVSDMSTPRLFEVQRLYRSVASMYVALQSFKKFVPVQVISNIIKTEKAATAELNPANLTIMFQDIEGFTSLSETMDPEALARLTSEYMEIMTEILCRHGGTIDKYIGDCIMTLFNAPAEVKDHEEKAALAAVECMRTLAEKNVQWKKEYNCTINCRIGMNTGNVLVGNMGGENRMNYTAFGDNVNVAARLEGVNKHFGTRIICSKSVYSTFKNKGTLMTRKLAKVRVSGKSLPTAIYEVSHNITGNTAELFGHYKGALKAFKEKDFVTASAKIQQARTINPYDKASVQLEKRIEEMSKETVPEDWSYVEDLSKY